MQERMSVVHGKPEAWGTLKTVLGAKHRMVFWKNDEADFDRSLRGGAFDDITIVIVGDLKPGQLTGEQVAAKLKGKYPDMTIVSFSDTQQKYGDLNLLTSTPRDVLAKKILELR